MTSKRITLLCFFGMLLGLIITQWLSVRNEGFWSGTAWMLNKDGYMITANHVVEHEKQLIVKYGQHFYKAIVIGVDRTNDIAIIKTNLKNGRVFPLGRSSVLSQNTAIMGFPVPDVKGLDVKLTIGHARQMSYGIYTVVQFNVSICPGNSGGPIFNQFGAAVGLVDRGHSFYQYDSNRCTTRGDGATVEQIKDLANKYHVAYTEGNYTEERSFNEWSKVYSNSVLLIYGSDE